MTANKQAAAETITHKKKTIAEFVATEFSIYLSQTLMFFIINSLTSAMLSNEKRLVTYMNTKAYENLLGEVGFTAFAVSITLGILLVITKSMPSSSWLRSLSTEVLNESPRTIYFLGSSISGMLLTAAVFVSRNPEVEPPLTVAWLAIFLIFNLSAFFYGCLASYIFKRKTHIINHDRRISEIFGWLYR